MNYKKMIKELAISFVVLVIILKFSFFNTSTAAILRGTLLFYLVFVIPGLLLTYLLFDELYILERYALSLLIGFIVMGILGYYSGIILDLHIRTAPYLIAPILIIVEGAMLHRKSKS